MSCVAGNTLRLLVTTHVCGGTILTAMPYRHSTLIAANISMFLVLIVSRRSSLTSHRRPTSSSRQTVPISHFGEIILCPVDKFVEIGNQSLLLIIILFGFASGFFVVVVNNNFIINLSKREKA